MAIKESLFETVEQLNETFADRVAGLLTQGIEKNGKATLVVSGGRTPQAMFHSLSKKQLAWDKVDITLADERWVDESDPASNGAMVRKNLLINEAQKATFIALKTSHSDARDAVEQCTAQLAAMKTPFDVLILGMGEDGHTASLFPCSQQIAQGLDLSSDADFIAVQPTTAPNQRMSLTLKALLNSENIFLHLTGQSKKDVLQQALDGDDELAMPIRAIINRAQVELVWAP